MNKSLINFIAEFTRGGESNLNNLRFLKDPYFREIVLNELSSRTKDAPILNRASYIDYGNIWNREIGETFYMPIVSFTSSNLKNGFYSFLRGKVIGDYEDWKYNRKADKLARMAMFEDGFIKSEQSMTYEPFKALDFSQLQFKEA